MGSSTYFVAPFFSSITITPMTEEEAKNIILSLWVRPQGGWVGDIGIDPRTGCADIKLDGDFHAYELEALAWWMRNKPLEKLPIEI